MEFSQEEKEILKRIFQDHDTQLGVVYSELDEVVNAIGEEKQMDPKELKESAQYILPDFWKMVDKMKEDPDSFFSLDKEPTEWAIQIMIAKGNPDWEDLEEKMCYIYFSRFQNEN